MRIYQKKKSGTLKLCMTTSLSSIHILKFNCLKLSYMQEIKQSSILKKIFLVFLSKQPLTLCSYISYVYDNYLDYSLKKEEVFFF